MQEDKRLLIAFMLSILIISGFYYFYKPQSNNASTAPIQSEQSNEQKKVGDVQPDEKQNVIKNETKIQTKIQTSSITKANEKIINLKGNKFIVKLSSKNAQVISFKLLDPQFKINNKSIELIASHDNLETGLYKVVFLRGGESYPENAVYELKSHSDSEALFYFNTGTYEITRHYKVLKNYQLKIKTTITNISNEPQSIRVGYLNQVIGAEKQTPDSIKRGVYYQDGICYFGNTFERSSLSDIKDDSITGVGNIKFVATDSLYFLNAISPNPVEGEYGCRVEAENNNLIKAYLELVEEKLAPGEKTQNIVLTYLGPKDYKLLLSLDTNRGLERSVDYGRLEWLCKILLDILKWLYVWFKNWGLAIIMLTILVKIILFPLTHKSFVNMRKMQEQMARIKPMIDEINEKYANNKDMKTQKTMELYQKHGINPLGQLGGCLPMLIQIPIWFALYTTLAKSVELYNSPFFGWLNDLSTPDKYYILPILLGVFMFVQQKLTPTTVDNTQAKIMMWMMPFMFLFFMLNMPSGLTLYIFVNTVLSILQQVITNKFLPPLPKTDKNKTNEKGSEKGVGGEKKSKKRR